MSFGIGLLKAGRDSGYGIKEARHCPSCSAEGALAIRPSETEKEKV